MPLVPQLHLRNVAIIAHVDHGKTTLVDAMLKFSHIFRENQQVGELIMDSNPQERERGITIMAKNTAISYKGVKINIIDTPGHVDFSGEVERVVNMADGCLLVVDAVDGPMPQTRSVLQTALGQGLQPVVIVNKIDRPMARISHTVSAIQDLFLEIATDADQLDFPVVYTSARGGYALARLEDEPQDIGPLFDAILEYIPAPVADPEGPLQMLTAALDYDNHLGQIAIGRVFRGIIYRGAPVALVGRDETATQFKADHLFTFRDLARQEVESIAAGDIAAVSGLRDVTIGDTIASPDTPEPLERIAIEEPTVKMTFGVNTSPFSGKDGRYATSRMLWDRLQRELHTNVSLRAERTESADEFMVSGRGELHLSVLIENMRREGLEFQVSRPEAVTKIVEGKPHEPYELLTVDTREEFFGLLTEELSSRLGQMTDMQNDGVGNVRFVYKLPTRGLIGFRSFFLRIARGNGAINSELLATEPIRGEVKWTRSGVIIATETGTAVTYGLRNAQERGETFVEPQTPVYEGMVVGMHNRDRDLEVNVCKERKMTNIRSSTSEVAAHLEPAVKFSLDEALDFMASDELVEVTPKNIRLRKRTLDTDTRYRRTRSSARAARS